MEVIKTAIDGVLIIEPRIFEDARGYFFESFSQREFNEDVSPITFVQENESCSSKYVVRGLHYQNPPFSQSKLVRCVKGSMISLALDLRRGSSTYGKCLQTELSEGNRLFEFIPHGFAHGFLVLSQEAVFTYKVDRPYAPQAEAGIRWNDPDLTIEWPIDPGQVQTSAKDLVQPLFKDAELFD